MAPPKEKNNFIIFLKKKKKKIRHVHHGGSWKIAYADFVTAMMAFFMLMWLINVTTDEQKKGIADYFSPSFVNTKSQNGSVGMMVGINVTGENNSDGKSSDEANFEKSIGEQEDNHDVEFAEKKQEVMTKPVEEAINQNPLDISANNVKQENNKDNKQDVIKDKASKKEKEELINSKASLDKNMDKSKDNKSLSEAQRYEQQQFLELTKEIKNIMKENPELQNLVSNLVVEIRPEGLLFQLIDQDKRSMFPSGSYSMLPHTKTLLSAVAKVIRKSHNRLSITGHTDATPYIDTHDYSNWELSVDRANACRRFLEDKGIVNARFESVVGKEATEPYVKNDPYAAQNRRIAILLLRENPIKL